MKTELPSVIVFFILYLGAAFSVLAILNKVFHSIEMLCITLGIAVIVALVVSYRRKSNRKKNYLMGKNSVNHLVNPFGYFCLTMILAGALALGTSIGKSFEIVALVSCKYESNGRGGVSYMLTLNNDKYGNISFGVPKKLWSNLQKESPIMLDVHLNIFGLAVVNDYEPLG